MASLAPKDSYADLTEKQQAVVDELVDAPDADNTTIAERADVARSTVYNVKQHYSDIVEQQLNKRRHEGTETTTGDPFAAMDEVLNQKRGTQMISERPVQPADDSGGEDADVDVEHTLPVAFTGDELRMIIRTGAVPDAVIDRIVNAVVDRALSAQSD